MTTRAVLVWDLPTRIFHWALVIAVVVSYVTGGEEGSWFVVHTVSGYVVALLLLFRLIWGFWGSAHSRFSDFIYSLGSVGAYVGRLVRLEPPKYVGHNPLGGWMVVLLLVVLIHSPANSQKWSIPFCRRVRAKHRAPSRHARQGEQ